jgi:superfamily I DNA/RNA helicase
MTELSPLQKRAVEHTGNLLIVGVPGSGKTQVLLQRAAHLVQKGESVAFVSFAFRGSEFLKAKAAQEYPGLWKKMKTGTVRDMAAAQLTAANIPFAFMSNNQMREILRKLMISNSFPGTLEDAELIIRSAKGRARKTSEADRHYPFIQAYKEKIEELGMMDRHDILRRHVIGMQDKSIQPVPVKYILIDNLQDATELQLIWLQQHLAAGVNLTLAADDDLTLYGAAGAMGPEAITQVERWNGMAKLEFPGTYRLGRTYGPAVFKVARQLRTRVGKPDDILGQNPGNLDIQTFETAPAEHNWVADKASVLAAEGKTVGIITHTDFEANVLAHALRRRGLNTASFARLIWEEPTPKLILSLLYVMLNQANNGHLHWVMAGFGLPAEAVTSMFENGLMAENWMPSGCPLPDVPEASPTTVASIQKFRRTCRAIWQLWQSQKMTPRDAFKSLVGEFLPNLDEAEQPMALLATDILLGLSGKLAEVLPRVHTETLPDMTSPITIAPVREVRSREFDAVILPYFSPDVWPRPASSLLGPNLDHERRLAYLALTRSRGDLIVTRHTPQPSTFLAEIQQSLGKKK